MNRQTVGLILVVFCVVLGLLGMPWAGIGGMAGWIVSDYVNNR